MVIILQVIKSFTFCYSILLLLVSVIRPHVIHYRKKISQQELIY